MNRNELKQLRATAAKYGEMGSFGKCQCKNAFRPGKDCKHGRAYRKLEAYEEDKKMQRMRSETSAIYEAGYIYNDE